MRAKTKHTTMEFSLAAQRVLDHYKNKRGQSYRYTVERALLEMHVRETKQGVK